jgi:hypothetical protein
MTSRIGKGLGRTEARGPPGTEPPSAYFLDLRTFRVFLVGLAADAFATAPGIKKSSSFLPDLMAAASHLGLRPRPARVSAGFSGLRYLGATEPIRSVRPNLEAFPPLVKPAGDGRQLCWPTVYGWRSGRALIAPPRYRIAIREDGRMARSRTMPPQMHPLSPLEVRLAQ